MRTIVLQDVNIVQRSKWQLTTTRLTRTDWQKAHTVFTRCFNATLGFLDEAVTTFPPIYPLARLSRTIPSKSPFTFPVSSTTSPSLPLSHFSSSLANVVPLPPLSRTLTHHAYLLIFLSPISCTIRRPIVVGLPQAFLVFNLS